MADNTSIVGSLFGTPEMYDQARREQFASQAAQLSQLNPSALANFYAMQTGFGAGDQVAGALGVKDPIMQQLSAVQGIMKGVNPNDPRSLMEAAQQLSSVAPQQAAVLAQQARAAQEQIAKIAKEKAQATSEGIVGKLLTSGKYTPESIAAFQESGKSADLVTVDKFTKPPSDFLSKAVELGFGEKARIGDYTPDQVSKINQAIFNEDISKKAAGAQAIRVDLGSALEKVYLSKDREEAAKRWSEAGKAYEATIPLLNQLDQVEKAVPNAFTGAGAEGKLALSKALGSFGVNIGTRATDTEYVNAISSKVVQQIARVFPGSLAVKELDQLVKSKFNVAQETPTILRLLGQIRDEMKAQALTYEQGSKLNDRDRTSFNSSLATGQNMQKINAYRDLENKYRQGTITDAERAQAKALKQELGL